LLNGSSTWPPASCWYAPTRPSSFRYLCPDVSTLLPH
jgi:hypothetical protein